MIKTIIQKPSEYRLDLTYLYNQLGISGKEPYLQHRWDTDVMVCKESLQRQKLRSISNERFVRVGSYGSMKVAYSVSTRIEKEYDVETSIFSVLVKSGTSYFVDVLAPNNDRQSLELMQKIMKNKIMQPKTLLLVKH